MPSKLEKQKIKLPRALDYRIKLSDGEREEIRKLYPQLSQRELAKKFKVSRSLIVFTLDKEKHRQNLLRRKEKGGSRKYYSREKHAKYMRKYRRSKKKRMEKYINLKN